jgi:hypothetical protein
MPKMLYSMLYALEGEALQLMQNKIKMEYVLRTMYYGIMYYVLYSILRLCIDPKRYTHMGVVVCCMGLCCFIHI